MPCTECKKSKSRYQTKKIDTLPIITWTPNLPSLLEKHQVSIALCAKEFNTILHINPDGEEIDTALLSTNYPLSLAYSKNVIAIGNRNYITILSSDNGVDFHKFSLHNTNALELHDLSFSTDQQLYFANTLFSCLSSINIAHNFVPQWKPDFISEYAPEKRCFLNGLGMHNGKPRTMTALSDANNSLRTDMHKTTCKPCAKGNAEKQKTKYWHSNIENSGLLIDIKNGDILEDLSIPNSPRWHKEVLYFLNSGEGQLCKVEKGTIITIANIPSFAQGLDFIGNLAFIGVSPIRENQYNGDTSVIKKLRNTKQRLNTLSKELGKSESTEQRNNIQKELAVESDNLLESNVCGVWIVDILRGEAIGYLQVDNIDSINDVKLLPIHSSLAIDVVNKANSKVYHTPQKTFRL